MKTLGINASWLVVELKKQQFALPAAHVRELLIMPDCAAVPGSPAHVRGVTNLRGRSMSVIDLRKRLGIASKREEVDSFCALMEQRQQDHVRWLDELDSCLRDGHEFKLATDPRRCAFGLWYHSYKSDDAWITALLSRFDEPHRQIHATAAEALALADGGNKKAALDLVDERRKTVLVRMIQLFTDLRDLARDAHQEIAVVLENGSDVFAASVDAALALETFAPEDIESVNMIDGNPGVQVAKRGKEAQPVLLLQPDALFNAADRV